MRRFLYIALAAMVGVALIMFASYYHHVLTSMVLAVAAAVLLYLGRNNLHTAVLHNGTPTTAQVRQRSAQLRLAGIGTGVFDLILVLMGRGGIKSAGVGAYAVLILIGMLVVILLFGKEIGRALMPATLRPKPKSDKK